MTGASAGSETAVPGFADALWLLWRILPTFYSTERRRAETDEYAEKTAAETR